MYIRVTTPSNDAPIGETVELRNYPTLSKTTVSGWGAIGFGLMALSCAVFVGLAVTGMIGGTAFAPDWVLWVCAGVFGLAGLLLCVYGVVDLVVGYRSKLEARAHPGEVWRADSVWGDAGSARGMKSRESGWWVVWGVALVIVVGLESVGVWVALTARGVGAVFMWFMVGIGALCVLIYALVFVKKVIGAVRYGAPRVVYETIPVRPGEMLAGRVLCPRGFGALEKVTITLRFVEEKYEDVPRVGKKPKSVVRVYGTTSDVWVIEDVRGALGAGGGAGVLPVSFVVPGDALETCARERPARFWDLEVRGKARGVDFLHRFLVPVYGG